MHRVAAGLCLSLLFGPCSILGLGLPTDSRKAALGRVVLDAAGNFEDVMAPEESWEVVRDSPSKLDETLGSSHPGRAEVQQTDQETVAAEPPAFVSQTDVEDFSFRRRRSRYGPLRPRLPPRAERERRQPRATRLPPRAEKPRASSRRAQNSLTHDLCSGKKSAGQKHLLINLVLTHYGDCSIVGDGLFLNLHGTLLITGNLYLQGQVRIMGSKKHLSGRCLVVEQSLIVADGAAVHISFCDPFGCAEVGEIKQAGGHLQLSRCEALYDGGCLRVLRGLKQTAGTISMVRCTAHARAGPGGCMAFTSKDPDIQTSGKLELEECGGGGVSMRGDSQTTWQGGGTGQVIIKDSSADFGAGLNGGGLLLSGLTMVVDNVHAKKQGGGFRLRGLTLKNAKVSIRDSSAKQGGGGIALDVVKGNLSVHGGFLRVERCHATFGGGGGLLVNGTLLADENAELLVANCSASRSGGGAALGELRLAGHAHVSISDCDSREFGGGLYLDGRWQSSNAVFQARDCTARSSGGCASVGTVDVAGPGSIFNFTACTSKRGFGGGLHVRGLMIGRDLTMSVSEGTAQEGGGCAWSKDADFSGGQMTFSICHAGHGNGGGLMLQGSWNSRKTSATFQDCRSGVSGGCFFSKEAELTDSSLKFDQCSAVSGHGGGLRVEDSLVMKNGLLSVTDGSAGKGGGCIDVKHFQASQGEVTLGRCRVEEGDGGGLLLRGRWTSEDSLVTIKDCAVTGNGGCAAMGFAQVTGWRSKVKLEQCRAMQGSGGGLQIRSKLITKDADFSLTQCKASKGGGCAIIQNADMAGGKLSFLSCNAQSEGAAGGGLRVDGKWTARDTIMSFEDCSAGSRGGCVSVGNLNIAGAKRISFKTCKAGRGGGGIFLAQHSVIRSPVQFETCFADESSRSGALHSHSSLELGEAHFIGGHTLQVDGDMSVQRFQLQDSTEAGIFSVDAKSLDLKEFLDCRRMSECSLKSQSQTALKVAGVQCSARSGRFVTDKSLECRRCPGDTVQLDISGRGPCMSCPKEAEKCIVNQLIMRNGFMVNLSNVSHSLHCPNPSACTGGDVSEPLCLPGHQGLAS